MPRPSDHPDDRPARVVRAGEVPLPGAAEQTRIAGKAVPTPMPVKEQHEPLRERYQAPGADAVPARTSRRGLAAAVAGAIALGVVTGWGLHWWDGRTPAAEATIAASNPSGARADRLVRGYLEALASGDTAAALAAGPAPTRGTTDLLEPEIFAAAREIAPVTEVRVANQSGTTTLVPASYRMGTKVVRADFQVRRDDAGAWQLVRTTRTVRLVGTTGRVPLLVNGQRLTPGSTVELLPGAYRLTTGLPFVDYAGDTIDVLDLGDGSVEDHQVSPRVTTTGQERVRRAVREALAGCTSQHSMAPEGCPYAFTASGSSAAPVKSSITVTMDEGDLTRATAVLDRDEPHVAVLSFTPTFRMTARYSDGSSTVSQPRTEQVQARIPITGRTGDPMPIAWLGR